MQGAVLDGSRALTSFDREGALFVASGQTQEGLRLATTEAEAGAVRAGFPETVFLDGQPLKPVASQGAVTAGTFYFDYAADRIFIADDPQGRTVEAGVASAAFASDATGVTISNLVIQHFNSPTQYGAIQGGENWTIENNEIRFNYGVGVTVQGQGRIVGNDVHDNGQMGIGGNGAGILVEGNEIHANGAWSGIDPFWEGGGSKFAETTDLVVRDNYSHDNHGFGLWTDIDNIRTLYEGNIVANNDGGGINHEISYDAVIRDNVLVGNGSAAQGDWLWGAQIQIQNSQNIDISGNRIDMSGGFNGIALIQQDRGTGAYGEYTTTGNTVHDNILVSTGGDGRSGAVADHDEAGLLNGGNVFSSNRYYMDAGNHWWWGDLPSGDTWAAYQSDTTQDEGSVLTQATPPSIAGWLGGSAEPTPPPIPVLPTPVDPPVVLPPVVLPPVVLPPVVVLPEPDPIDPDDGTSVGDGEDVVGTGGADDLEGRVGSLEIHGLAGADRLNAGPGDEALFGGSGSDSFVFSNDGSTDSIEDFTLSGRQQDVVVLHGTSLNGFDEVLAAASDVGDDAMISFGTTHVLLNDISVAELEANDFLFA